ncbi:MAG: hypothetical protein ABW208_28120 [Pyrinomonadaceae bacterium]
MRVKVGVMGSASEASRAKAERLIGVLPKKSSAVVVFDEDPERLLDRCLEAFDKGLSAED